MCAASWEAGLHQRALDPWPVLWDVLWGSSLNEGPLLGPTYSTGTLIEKGP